MNQSKKNGYKDVYKYEDSLISDIDVRIIRNAPQIVYHVNALRSLPLFAKRALEENNIPLPIILPEPIPCETIHEAASIMQNEPLSCNGELCRIITNIQPVVTKLLEDAKLLQHFMCLVKSRMPPAYFNEVETEVVDVKKDVEYFYANVKNYFEVRATMLANVFKDPFNNGYRTTIREHDDVQNFTLYTLMRDLRDHFITLRMLAIKNLEERRRQRFFNIGDGVYV